MTKETSAATAEAVTAEAPPTEAQKTAASEDKKIEQYVKDHGEKELAAEKSSAADADAGKAAPASELSDEDKQWLECKKLGVARDDLVRYAKKGWDAEHEKGAKAEKKAEQEPAAESAAAGDEAYEPVTRAEFNEGMQRMESKTRLTVAQAQNQLKLEGLLAGHELTREDPDTAEMVERKTYELMGAGKPLGTAFSEATEKHADYLRRQHRGFLKKKIAQQQTRGETTPGEAATTPLPTFEHKDRDFEDGTALDHAMQMMKTADRVAAGRPL